MRCDCLCCVMSRDATRCHGDELLSVILYYKVVLCTTKYYSSTTLYYSSTTPYYKVLLQYYSSTTLYYSVLQRTTPVLQSTTPILPRATKHYSSTIPFQTWFKSFPSRFRLFPTIASQAFEKVPCISVGEDYYETLSHPSHSSATTNEAFLFVRGGSPSLWATSLAIAGFNSCFTWYSSNTSSLEIRGRPFCTIARTVCPHPSVCTHHLTTHFRPFQTIS